LFKIQGTDGFGFQPFLDSIDGNLYIYDDNMKRSLILKKNKEFDCNQHFKCYRYKFDS
jgi:uncharacterized protein YllA (UPF0747 family)